MNGQDQADIVGPYARSLYPFSGDSWSNELSFDADEIVRLIRRVDENWLEGRIRGKSGIFPANFVQIVVDLDEPVHDNDDGIGLATARFAFDARQPDELSVQPGEQLRVLQMVNTEWAKCRSATSDRTGIIPTTFLDIFLDEEIERSVQEEQQRPVSMISSSHSDSIEVGVDALQICDSVGWDLSELQGPKKVAPPRPPPPATRHTWMKKQTSVESISHRKQSTAISPDEKITKILTELVVSEEAFQKDMEAFIMAAESCASFPESSRQLVSAVITPVSELSRRLSHYLRLQLDRPFMEREVGSVFLDFRSRFAETYSFFFRNLDKLTVLMSAESSEDSSSEILRRMRSLHPATSCFEATSTVARPVHRCLKYPLFLDELVKNTPIQHPDHPKLLQAFKLMSNLGSKMNESKRRKELVQKYGSKGEKTLSERIASINMHSLMKKSTRFRVRLGNQIGITDLPKDSIVERMVDSLYTVERKCVAFNYYLTILEKKTESEMNNLVLKLIELIEPHHSHDKTKVRETQKAIEDTVTQWKKNVHMSVRHPLSLEIRSIPKKLIQKRFDKLVDYHAAKSKNPVGETVGERFAEYQALNNQVKMSLPRVTYNLEIALANALYRISELESSFKEELGTAFSQFTQIIIPNVNYNPRADLDKAWRDVMRKLKKTAMARPVGDIDPQTKEMLQRVILKRDIHSKRNTLYSVVADWPQRGEPVAPGDLMQRAGDVVSADSSREVDGRRVCWNGAKMGRLPIGILREMSMNEVHKLTPNRPHSTPIEQPKENRTTQQHPQTHKNNDVNLIDLDVPEIPLPTLTPQRVAPARAPSMPLLHDPFEFNPNGDDPSRTSLFDLPSSSSLIPSSPSFLPPPHSPSLSSSVLQPTRSTPSKTAVVAFPVSFDDAVPSPLSSRPPLPSRAPIRVVPLPPPVPTVPSFDGNRNREPRKMTLSATNPFADLYDLPPGDEDYQETFWAVPTNANQMRRSEDGGNSWMDGTAHGGYVLAGYMSDRPPR